MNSREMIIDRIQKMPEPYLLVLYDIIKHFEASKKKVEPRQSLMSKLRRIKISVSSDFSQTADLYVPGENNE